LKEIESDNMLIKYSVVIIDEAHERTINTDIISLISKIIKLRYLLSKYEMKYRNENMKPLRLVIMSATMRVDEFIDNNIFTPKPALIEVEARQFPVIVHHIKRTFKDHLEEAFKMTCKIHRKLPDGGILIFLMGKQEIKYLCERLKSEFENNYIKEDNNNNGNIEEKEPNTDLT
jgi:ATP-dependent RNA helicase DHX37/DHR1